MRIALVGYGKMGKLVEQIAGSQNHEIVHIVDSGNKSSINDLYEYNAEVVIEFTNPDSAMHNFEAIISQGLPLVTGTTGWYDQIEQVKKMIDSQQGSFIYASNFSVGVNVFKCMNAYLSKLMKDFPQFKAYMKEVHHTQKLDAPSGTAITLAEQIINNSNYESWGLASDDSDNSSSIQIEAERIKDVLGDHHIYYESDIDLIEISHKAKSRKGFASGAILAAEWLMGKEGFYSINDMYQFDF